MLCAMPLELQLSIADAVDERCDRAALALASPRLGLAACRQLPSYQGLEMSLAFYLVLGGAIDERLLRGYASRSEATPEGCKRLAAVAGLQISRSASGRRSGCRWNCWFGVPRTVPSRPATAPLHQIRVAVSDTGHRWYLMQSGSTVGALLRHGVEPQAGRVQSLFEPRHCGTVFHYEGEEGAERMVRVKVPGGLVMHYEGEQGAERVVRCEVSGTESHFEGEHGAERLVRAELSGNHFELPVRIVQHFTREGKRGLLCLELPYGGVIQFEEGEIDPTTTMRCLRG